MKKNIRQGVESLRGAFENTAKKKQKKKQVSNDGLQQKSDDLNNKFQVDFETSERMSKRIKDAAEEELSRINE